VTHFITQGRIYSAVAVVLILSLWALSANWVGEGILLPSPAETWREFSRILQSGTYWLAVGNTTARSLVSFFITFVVASLCAVFAHIWKPLGYLFEQLVVIFKAAPPISIVLLALIWLGSERSPILVGFLVVFPVIYTNIVTGMSEVDQKLLEMARVYRISRFRQLYEIYLPSIMPYVLAACSTAMGMNLRVVIMTEVISQPRVSMGTSLHLERVFLNTGGVFAWTLTAIVLAAIFDFGLDILRRRVVAWK